MTDAVTKIEAPAAPVEQRQGHMISMIERVAMSPEMPVEKLEQMLALQERIWEREARQAFNMAISLARAEIAPIVKTSEVDFTGAKGRTHYKHETLDGIARQIDPILAANGLSYRFRTAQNGGQVSVTCIIAHRGGYSEETTLAGPPDNSGSKNAYQAVGSAVTYLQRYTLKAALGLSAAKDDDAQSFGRNPELPGPPVFDATQEADRIRGRIDHADTLDELSWLWRNQEGPTIFRIKRERPDLFDSLNAAKDARRRALEPPKSGEILDDEIPY